MTADDIIAANPQHSFTRIDIHGREGLSYIDARGVEQWMIWEGERWVDSSAPWDQAKFEGALEGLMDFQPGNEFRYAGDDRKAAMMREIGLAVWADEDGALRIIPQPQPGAGP